MQTVILTPQTATVLARELEKQTEGYLLPATVKGEVVLAVNNAPLAPRDGVVIKLQRYIAHALVQYLDGGVDPRVMAPHVLPQLQGISLAKQRAI